MRLRLFLLSLLALICFVQPAPREAQAAAMSSLQGYFSISAGGNAIISTTTPANAAWSSNKQINFSTGTGTGLATADMVYSTTLTLSSGASAASIDLRSVAQGGNTQVMVYPKYFLWEWISGSGSCFLDRGAANGYTGFPADGITVSSLRPFAFYPATVVTSATDKTVDYSETGSASVVCKLTVVGTSA